MAPLTADAFCQTYAARVYKFAQLVSSDSADAEDLAQDALERAIRGLNTFNPAKGEVEGLAVAHRGQRRPRRRQDRRPAATCLRAACGSVGLRRKNCGPERK